MKTMHTRLIPLLALSIALAAAAHAQSAKPKVLGVLFYADWCASCKKLDPKIEAIKTDFADKPILFTRVDFTNDYTKLQSDLLAAALNLGPSYAEQGRKTGFMLLLDAETGQPLGRLTSGQNEAELKQSIAAALGG